MKPKVGVLGATGYVGAELLRLLVGHRGVEISWLTSEKFAGKRIEEVFPQLRGFLDLECVNIARLGDLGKVDVVFSCLPQGTSMHFVGRLLKNGARVIDLSADFRMRDPCIYENLYRTKHIHRDLLKEAVYGLPEIYRERIREASLVANPGCYATSVILGLAPLFSSGLAKGDSVIADSKSGLTGAGRAPSLEHLFPESNESVSAHGVMGHDQRSEIEQELSNLGGIPTRVTFIPHTVPMSRGILTTIYVGIREEKDHEYVLDLYKKYYSGKPFIRVYERGGFPSVKNVRFSNLCDIGIGFQDGVFIPVVALDNLGKGAAGQAVQNMNVMLDLPEDEGLKYPGMYP